MGGCMHTLMPDGKWKFALCLRDDHIIFFSLLWRDSNGE